VNTTLTLKERYIDLLARQGIDIREPRGMVRCLFHPDKTASLSIDKERGLFHCFGCGVSGGVLKFAELLGEKWTPRRSESPEARAARAARDRVREDFCAWDRECTIAVTDAYRALLAEREVAEIACRAIKRCPDLYTPREHTYWTLQLASPKEQIDSLEHEVDVFTYKKFESERFARWAAEQQKKKEAA
jgi:hypothetical protein